MLYKSIANLFSSSSSSVSQTVSGQTGSKMMQSGNQTALLDLTATDIDVLNRTVYIPCLEVHL
ncbi:hypothetical protein PPL_02892 [Heterostelium album PN500]|uniref:Uncharacterized protein n=1 Tax=Heterostelium pallidum (strain ATCC 26659 / Pp 5 / PN500) TaxID=670386 RepID=D3B3C6_HETP5|nr:hypothetical protein PPL_02892 [Heterostelium album PN500]EFA83824.1 hypothetical protein PPL_02892 [Heterostelium album PN500]|eukprot:XP_020435941.1 hypothetical protein PPL_02892 [Heterostelium album PN500]